jgi:hypothetical protein
MSDPFANNDPFAPQQQNTPAAAPWSEPAQPTSAPAGGSTVVVNTSKNLSLTMKQHAGHDAPWLVLYADTPAEAKALLAEVLNVELPNALAVTASRFAATASGQAPAQSQGRPPQPQQSTPPGEEVKYCDHGERVFKTGNGQYGVYKAWFCRLSKNDPNQCNPIFGK